MAYDDNPRGRGIAARGGTWKERDWESESEWRGGEPGWRGYPGGGIGRGAYAGGFDPGPLTGWPAGAYESEYMIGGSVGPYAGGFGGRQIPLAGSAGMGIGGGFAGGYTPGASFRGPYGSPYGSGYHPETAVRGLHFGRGPRNYRRSDDRIEEEINERLTFHPEINAEDLDVRVKKGEVKLSGTVETRYEKRLAEDLADSCFGVVDVKNEIHIKRSGREHETGEREIQPPVVREDRISGPRSLADVERSRVQQREGSIGKAGRSSKR